MGNLRRRARWQAKRGAGILGAVVEVHSRIINDVAKEELQPLGLQRKGRSRLWYDDHGWWLINVEFQPSGFSKGSYLNVGGQHLFSTSASGEEQARSAPSIGASNKRSAAIRRALSGARSEARQATADAE